MDLFLKKIKLLAFDLDGTLYMGDKAMAGAAELIEYLQGRYQVAFFTNNSAKTIDELHGKLNRLGFRCKINEVYASSTATGLYLKETSIDNIYIIGSKGFREELKRLGLNTIDDETAENLVVGYDPELNYGKITTALTILLNGGRFVVCNEDEYYPVGGNRFLPGCGAMVGAIVGAVGKTTDYVVGKPNTYILSRIANAFYVEHDEILVIGDSYGSDIKMAMNYNSKAIWVNANNRQCDGNVLVIDDLHDLLKYVKGQ